MVKRKQQTPGREEKEKRGRKKVRQQPSSKSLSTVFSSAHQTEPCEHVGCQVGRCPVTSVLEQSAVHWAHTSFTAKVTQESLDRDQETLLFLLFSCFYLFFSSLYSKRERRHRRGARRREARAPFCFFESSAECEEGKRRALPYKRQYSSRSWI
jgi:hypothetical protein